jgi:hypothetical protein
MQIFTLRKNLKDQGQSKAQSIRYKGQAARCNARTKVSQHVSMQVFRLAIGSQFVSLYLRSMIC